MTGAEAPNTSHRLEKVSDNMSYQTVNLEIEVDSEEIARHVEPDDVARYVDHHTVAQHVADNIDVQDVAGAMDMSNLADEVRDNIDMDDLAESIMRRANPELLASIRKLTETMQHVAKIGGAL